MPIRLGELPPREARIWRYFDVYKLESLLEKEALYFASARQFADAFEGSITKAEYQLRYRPSEHFAPDTEYIRLVSGAFRELTRLTKINCWHMNEGESAAMWSLYLRDGKGVALQSTIGRFIQSFSPFRLRVDYAEEDVWVGRLLYINYATNRLRGDSFIAPFFHKRRSFAHEAEFRAVISLRLSEEFGVIVPDDGVLVQVDLDTLIETIYVAPAVDVQSREAISQLITAYRVNAPVKQSELDEPPLFLACREGHDSEGCGLQAVKWAKHLRHSSAGIP